MEPSYDIWCQNTAKSTWQVPVYAWQRVRVCWRPRKLRRPEVVSETLHESKLWKSAIWWSWHAKRSKSLKRNGGLCDRWSLSCKRSGPSHCFLVARVMVCWLRLGLSLDHFDFGVHTCPNYKVLFTETWPDKTNIDRFFAGKIRHVTLHWLVHVGSAGVTCIPWQNVEARIELDQVATQAQTLWIGMLSKSCESCAKSPAARGISTKEILPISP